MIPINGSINVLSVQTLGTTALTGNLTYTTANNVTGREREVIIQGGASIGGAIAAALASLRISPYLFLKGTGIPTGARIVATESPTTYPIGSFNWGLGTLTINTTIPVATVIGQKVTISGASIAALNGTFTATNASASAITVALASNPGTLTGVTGLLKPGIVDTTIDGSSTTAGRGYYTINMNTTAAATQTNIANPCWTPVQLPAGTTHVFATAVTATNALADIIMDGVGTVTIPCLNLLSFKNLKAGTYIIANGGAATDVTKLAYCTLNPFGNS
jgi:hypothetical protein